MVHQKTMRPGDRCTAGFQSRVYVRFGSKAVVVAIPLCPLYPGKQTWFSAAEGPFGTYEA
jgi:hypothetical protein